MFKADLSSLYRLKTFERDTEFVLNAFLKKL